MTVRVAHGIDLGGFTTGTSRVVRAEVRGQRVVLRRVRSSLDREVKGTESLDGLRRALAAELAGWRREGPVVVDVPLDLQGLPSPTDARFVWQTTRRTIDYVLGALPPLADRLGAAVARWRALAGNEGLGTTLFEGYPAACLALSDCDVAYKGCEARPEAGAWQGRRARPANRATAWAADHAFVRVLALLRVECAGTDCLGDDDVDAAMCALSGLPGPHVLEGAALLARLRAGAPGMRAHLHSEAVLPAGFRVADFRTVPWTAVAYGDRAAPASRAP